MNRKLTILAAGASLFASLAVPAQAASDVSLARFDCGTPQAPTPVNQRFSDTYAFGDLKVQFVFSCSHQTWRRLYAVGYGPSPDRAQRRAQG